MKEEERRELLKMAGSLVDFFPEEWILDELPETLEEALGYSLPFLDYGFLQLVDYMGDDMAVPDGARASYRESAKMYSEERNAGLINYLTEHRHTSPSELVQIKFRMKVPLSVRAQHVRHRMQSCNWESHRYKEPDGDYYVPPIMRVQGQDQTNRQGSDGSLEYAVGYKFTKEARFNSERAMISYKDFLQQGVSRETARDLLPTNTYTTGIWSMNLHNLLHYLGLRTHPHSQPEIRLLAFKIERIVKKYWPISYEAWLEFSKEAVTFSRSEIQLLRQLLLEFEITPEDVEDQADMIESYLDGNKRRMKQFVKKLSPEYF